ncbi:MAG TPA: cytochrome d ubiquinol oxidase subunit II [Frankiaceae bacterium]|nr:cytochrome d ubiquinol oxidase subunit II [Frankiaceae bacterium]
MLREFWFLLIGVLWGGYFLLEGFDYGVGILSPAVSDDEVDRSVALGTLGPVWDGNEVWLIVAGGATFAAFPEWYASMFSGFYLALFLILVGLILRGICIEYRHRAESVRGRAWCDTGVFVGSLLPALLIGVAFADLLRGVKMDAGHNVIGGFFDLVTPYGLLGGLATLSLFCLHGAVFLALKSSGPVRTRSAALSRVLGPVAVVVLSVFLLWTALSYRANAASVAVSVIVVAAVAVAAWLAQRDRDGWAFVSSAVATVALVGVYFLALHPDVMPARNNPAFGLTIDNASSSAYTLKVMTIVAVFLTPIVLAYEAWTYWVFRKRLSRSDMHPLVPTPRANEGEARQVERA